MCFASLPLCCRYVADVCRYPHIATVRYPCSGCHRGLPRNHPSHTLSVREGDRCRIAVMQRSEAGDPQGRAPAGPRPAAHQRRDPRVEPAAREPAQGEPAQQGEPEQQEGMQPAIPADVADGSDARGLATAGAASLPSGRRGVTAPANSEAVASSSDGRWANRARR